MGKLGKLSRLAKLPPGDALLLLKAAVLLSVVHLGLRIFPFRSFQAFLAKPRWRRRRRTLDARALERLAWAVGVAARPPLGTCLTQALVLQWLLSRRMMPTRLWLGVHREVDTEPEVAGIHAHAWLEHEEQIIAGGPGRGGFVPMSHFDGAGAVTSDAVARS